MILGIDEVGRGPWAGPLVVGAVVLGGAVIDGLTDSKKLTKKRRNELAAEVRTQAAGFGLGWVSASEIDQIGLAQSLRLATRRAVEQVTTSYHEIIIDGTINFLENTTKSDYVVLMKKADLLVPSVSAASIIAKVARDDYMSEQDAAYPGYGFKSHVGYGTAQHRAAIEKFGVTREHRLSFAPLNKYQTNQVASTESSIQAPVSSASGAVSTRAIGDSSESVATAELMRRGHTILERNWRTKYCEIDIISQKGQTVFFTEVKHRKNPQVGDGLDAITPKKLNQMKFAAKLYVHVNQLDGKVNMQLLAVATTGEQPALQAVIEVT